MFVNKAEKHLLLAENVLWLYTRIPDCLFSSTAIFPSHTYPNQDNPKEKHLWRRESSVAPFEVIWVGFTRGIGSWCVQLLLSLKTAPTSSTYCINKQVNAQVRVIGRTKSQTRNSSATNAVTCLSSWTVWRKKKSKFTNTTPTNSTYCFQKASICLC